MAEILVFDHKIDDPNYMEIVLVYTAIQTLESVSQPVTVVHSV